MAAPKGSGLRGALPDGFCACPIDTTFEAIGKKWTVLVLRNLLWGDQHFTELLHHIQGINPKSLSARLKELERHELVARKVVETSPVRIEYHLTAKGYAIFPVMRSMARWSLRWAPERVFADGRRPEDLDTCLESWQKAFFSDDEVEFERGVDVVSAAPKRRAGPERTNP